MLMMAAMGQRKTARPAMKVSNDAAEWTIFHGTITHPAVIVIRMAPLRMLMYLYAISQVHREFWGAILTWEKG